LAKTILTTGKTMIRILILALALTLTACATQQPTRWSKPGALEADYNRDVAQCDYETSASTQGTDYSYRTVIGQEIDRAMRKNELLKKCMVARGWSASTSSTAATQVVNSTPTLSQKEKWLTTMAEKNGCEGAVRVDFKNKAGIREVFDASCENKTLEFTCEFSGPVTEAMGGIPFVAVTGKSYQTQPACWR
jgi:hypothetical protein